AGVAGLRAHGCRGTGRVTGPGRGVPTGHDGGRGGVVLGFAFADGEGVFDHSDGPVLAAEHGPHRGFTGDDLQVTDRGRLEGALEVQDDVGQHTGLRGGRPFDTLFQIADLLIFEGHGDRVRVGGVAQHDVAGAGFHTRRVVVVHVDAGVAVL